jgi:hypothetical protein
LHALPVRALFGSIWENRDVRRWELWRAQHSDGGVSESFFPDDEVSGTLYRAWAEADGGELVWTVEAKGMNDTMRAMYEFLGRPAYQPPLRPDGTPYPEDEDDDYARVPD